jgi:hypothetical protein
MIVRQSTIPNLLSYIILVPNELRATAYGIVKSFYDTGRWKKTCFMFLPFVAERRAVIDINPLPNNDKWDHCESSAYFQPKKSFFSLALAKK